MSIAKVNGININYKVEGRGKPLLMIAGLGSDQNVWMFQTYFFKKHFQVITFDNRGVGESDKPKGPYTTRMMADDTVGLMEHLGLKKAHILGISMGGMIAQEMAINYPERILKLVLGCTYAYVESALNGNHKTAEWDKVVELSQQVKVGSMVSLAFNKNLCEDSLSKIGFEAQAEACRTHQTLDRLPFIKSPTLVIVGTKDEVFKPISSEVVAKNIRGAKLVKLENGSHSFFIEMREHFNKEVLNFLKNSQ